MMLRDSGVQAHAAALSLWRTGTLACPGGGRTGKSACPPQNAPNSDWFTAAQDDGGFGTAITAHPPNVSDTAKASSLSPFRSGSASVSKRPTLPRKLGSRVAKLSLPE